MGRAAAGKFPVHMGGTDYEDIRITTDMDADGGQLKDGKPVFEEVRCPVRCGAGTEPMLV